MSFDSVFRPGLLRGQTIIVTGGGSGIGRCTAHELAHLGATVALVGRTARQARGRRSGDRGRRRQGALLRVRHPRGDPGARHRAGRARRDRPHRRPGEQRRRAVRRTARRDQPEGLGHGGAQQPDRRLPVRARVLHAVDGGPRRRDRQRGRRLLGQHAGHGALGRGARGHGRASPRPPPTSGRRAACA